MSVISKHSSMVFSQMGKTTIASESGWYAEKGVAVEIINVEKNQYPEDLVALNPYNSLPTLVDRDLVLYETMIMMEYLDERFPHPPLVACLPCCESPESLVCSRIQKDWCGLVDTIVAGRSKETVIEKARKELREGLITIAPIFTEKEFFMNDEFTLVDCCFAPILWRLPVLGISLPPKSAKPLTDYMNRMFRRESFQASLSEAEMDMRD